MVLYFCKRKQKKLVIRLVPCARTFVGFYNFYKYYTKCIMFFNNKTYCVTLESVDILDTLIKIIKTFISLQERADGGIFYAKI